MQMERRSGKREEMTAEQIFTLAEEFEAEMEERLMSAEEERQAIELERQFAVRNCLEQAFWELDKARRLISHAIDAETDKKRVRLMLRSMSDIDMIQTDVEELM